MERLDFCDEGDDKTTPSLIVEKPGADRQQTLPFLVSEVGAKPKSFTKPVPPSDLLQRLQSFLPEMKRANDALRGQSPSDISIETDGRQSSQYIEMNLGLGVFEAKDGAATDLPIHHQPQAEEGNDALSLEDFLLKIRQATDTETDSDDVDQSDADSLVS